MTDMRKRNIRKHPGKRRDALLTGEMRLFTPLCDDSTLAVADSYADIYGPLTVSSE
jgi:hypothetical protein